METNTPTDTNPRQTAALDSGDLLADWNDTPRVAAQAYYIDGYYHISADLGRQLERELLAFRRSNERIIRDYNALLRDLKAAQLDCGNAEKRCDAAIVSWDEERERARREAGRVVELRARLEAIRSAADEALSSANTQGQPRPTESL